MAVRLGPIAELLASLRVLSREFSLLERLDDGRVVQYAEELFDGLMIVRLAWRQILSEDRLGFPERVSNHLIGVAHALNLKARAVNPGEQVVSNQKRALQRHPRHGSDCTDPTHFDRQQKRQLQR
jgi:hypothetical protein